MQYVTVTIRCMNEIQQKTPNNICLFVCLFPNKRGTSFIRKFGRKHMKLWSFGMHDSGASKCKLSCISFPLVQNNLNETTCD